MAIFTATFGHIRQKSSAPQCNTPNYLSVALLSCLAEISATQQQVTGRCVSCELETLCGEYSSKFNTVHAECMKFNPGLLLTLHQKAAVIFMDGRTQWQLPL
jgi:hypothetical protein